MEKEKKQPGFMCYWDLVDTMMLIPDEEIKPILAAVKNYCISREIPNLQGNLRVLWPMIQQKLDLDCQRYETIRSQNQVKGLISNFKRNYAPVHGLDPTDPKALYDYLQGRGIENPEQWTGVDPCPPNQPDTETNRKTNTFTNSFSKTKQSGGPFSDLDGEYSGCITEEKKREQLAAFRPLLRDCTAHGNSAEKPGPRIYPGDPAQSALTKYFT